MCQRGRGMAERLLQPSPGPRDRYLCEREPAVLSKHRTATSQSTEPACASPLIPLLADKSHPVYSGGQICRLSLGTPRTRALWTGEKNPASVCTKRLGKDSHPLCSAPQGRRDPPTAMERGQSHVGRGPELCPHQEHPQCPQFPQPESPGLGRATAAAPTVQGAAGHRRNPLQTIPLAKGTLH